MPISWSFFRFYLNRKALAARRAWPAATFEHKWKALTQASGLKARRAWPAATFNEQTRPRVEPIHGPAGLRPGGRGQRPHLMSKPAPGFEPIHGPAGQRPQIPDWRAWPGRNLSLCCQKTSKSPFLATDVAKFPVFLNIWQQDLAKAGR